MKLEVGGTCSLHNRDVVGKKWQMVMELTISNDVTAVQAVLACWLADVPHMFSGGSSQQHCRCDEDSVIYVISGNKTSGRAHPETGGVVTTARLLLV